MDNNLNKLEEKLGYKYNNIGLLENALTHSSYANEMKARGKKISSNERLEFLGDSVLALITSEYIYLKLKDYKEGELTKLRAAIVCEESLCGFSESLEIGKALYLGKGEIATNGRNRKSILADAFEAVLGSVFLDGGLDAAKQFLIKFIEKAIADFIREGELKDYKSLLQQLIQQNGTGEVLEYVLLSESGPDHNKIFEIKVSLNNNILGQGKGRSKKIAEQNAAREALTLFGYKN
jgi:ribonuclease-3